MSDQPHVLLVEDDASLNEMLVEELTADGYRVDACRSAEAAFEILAKGASDRAPELVVTDLQLPGADGMALLSRLMQQSSPPAVLMITAFGTVDRAVEALKAGADEFLTKPLDMEHLLILCRRLLEHRRLRADVSNFRGLIGEQDFHGMIGRSPPMRELFDQIVRIARADGPVLVSGPSGAGKEGTARAVHAESRRSEQRFVAVNCAAVPADLLESEFFGYSAGAFTGAERARPGLFREADGGTLFLDEISEMPPGLQVRLLRALQDGRIRPVGDEKEIQVDVRVIAASNRDLEGCVAEGSFREDLYYRLETFHIQVPALAARGDDIELLAQQFLLRHAAVSDRPARRIGEQALKCLVEYDWPGNVRELGNAMERAATFCNGDVVEPEHLPERVRKRATRSSADRPGGGIPDELLDQPILPTLDELRERYVHYVLDQAGGNKRRAAALLGIGRRTLYRWLDAPRDGEPDDGKQ